MNRFRLIATFFVISIGLVGSYFILKNSGSLPGVKPTASTSDSNLMAQISPIKWVEQPKKDLWDSSSNSNITDQFAASVFDKMRKTDANGQNPFSGVDFNDSEKELLIQEVLANVDFSKIFNISIADRDLNIDSDNSLVKKIRYLDTTGGIISNYLIEPYKNPMKAIKKMIEEGDNSDVKKLESIYENIYKSFLGTSVPLEWVGLHKRYLILLKKAQITYAGIVNFQNDPVKGEILIKLVPDIINEELSIKEEYAKKVKELSLYL